jgi:hypothetical protein
MRVVLLIGEHHGAVQPSGLSATHQEYREAGERKPVLVFVEEPATGDEQQAAFLTEVQDWATGHFRRVFSDPASLKAAVVQGLHEHELAVSYGSFDQAECRTEPEASCRPTREASALALSWLWRSPRGPISR